MHGTLETLLRNNKEAIIREWVSGSRKSSQFYAGRPEYELKNNFRLVFDAYISFMSKRDGGAIRDLVRRIVTRRLDSGFGFEDIQGAMALFRTTVRPHILREIPGERIDECLGMIDECVDYSIRFLGVESKEHYEEKAMRMNQALAETLEELEEERTNAMAVNKIKDQLLANMSHELKTPLTSIIGFSKTLMITSEAQPSLKEKMRVIYDQGKTLLRLINTLLTIAEINSGVARLGRDAVDIRDVADLAWHGVKQLKESYGRNIHFSSVEEEILVMGDAEKLFVVIFELIVNGLKFSEPKGEVFVNCAKDDRNAVITVRDDGIGIDPADLNKIFDPFYQADGSIIRRYGGSGIGLTMIKKVVELHDGSVTVESEPGKGSAFSVRIPLAKKPG